MSKLPNKIDNIISKVRKNGFNPVVGNVWLMQEYWKTWWRGNVNGFHSFSQKINGVTRKFDRLTLNTFKMVCEEWESLIWSEKVELKVTNNDQANERLQEVLKENNDYIEMGNLIEKTFALGTGLTLVYKSDNKTQIDYISGQRFIPIAFENNKMTGVITINESIISISEKPAYVTHLTYHYLENDVYTIKHEVYVSDKDSDLGQYSFNNIYYVFSKQEADAMVTTIITEDGKTYQTHQVTIPTNRAFFQLYRPNITNNYDESVMGISIGANTINLHESIDIKFDASKNEILNNKTRIIVNSKFLKTQAVENEQTGGVEYIKYLDDQDTVVFGIPFEEDENVIEHFQGEFRTEDIKVGLNEDIQLLGWRSGFGKKYFSFTDGEVYVNDKNVMSSNSALYKNKKKHENLIGQALLDKAYSILYLEQDMGNIQVDVNSLIIEVQFDDSIINDDETILATMKTDASEGFIPKWRYVMNRYKLTEQEAKDWVKEADEEDSFNASIAIESQEEPEEPEMEENIEDESEE